MTQEIQRRAFEAGISVRAEDGGGGAKMLEGYALKWSETVAIGRWFRENFKKGAFKDSIKSGGQKMLLDHSGLPVGSRSGGTLTLTEDDTGLRFVCEVNTDSARAHDAVIGVSRGDIDGVSVGFRIGDYEYTEDDDEDPPDLITHTKCELWEISLVAFPAYASSEVGVRAAEDFWRALPRRRDMTVSETADRIRRNHMLAAEIAASCGALYKMPA